MQLSLERSIRQVVILWGNQNSVKAKSQGDEATKGIELEFQRPR